MPSVRDSITKYDWENLITVAFVLIEDGYRTLMREARPGRHQGPAPVFSDTEVITVAFLCEYLFGGNEKMTLAFLNN